MLIAISAFFSTLVKSVEVNWVVSTRRRNARGDGGCDGEAEAFGGSNWKGRDEVSRAARRREEGRQAAVLAGDRDGTDKRGRSFGCGCITAGGNSVVPGGRRHATIT